MRLRLHRKVPINELAPMLRCTTLPLSNSQLLVLLCLSSPTTTLKWCSAAVKCFPQYHVCCDNHVRVPVKPQAFPAVFYPEACTTWVFPQPGGQPDMLVKPGLSAVSNAILNIMSDVMIV